MIDSYRFSQESIMEKIFLFLWLAITLTNLANAQEGKELFDEAKCMECHTQSDFAGQTSKAKNFRQMDRAVDACQFNNNAEWFDEDREMVSDYLNDTFYKFEKEK